MQNLKSNRRSKRFKIVYKVLIYAVLTLGAIFSLLPFYWMLRSSLMEMGQIFEMPPIWIPDPIKWENYHQALTILPFARYLLNTLIIVVGVVAGTVLTSALSAYAFARLKWKGRNLFFGLLMSSIMLPFAVTLIPTFVGWSALGLTNTYVPLILPAYFGGGVANIFMLRQFYTTIPKELDEAAVMDGANHLTIFFRIIVPASKSALTVVGMFSFIGAWNDFLGPLVYIHSPEQYTAALGLHQFRGLYNAEWHLMMAASAVVIIPLIVVFFVGQRYLVEGITLTGIKG